MKEVEPRFENSRAIIQSCRAEMGKRIVGQQNLIDGIL